MTKFMQKSFSVGGTSTDEYRKNYERIFSKTHPKGQEEPLPNGLENASSVSKNASLSPENDQKQLVIYLHKEHLAALQAWHEGPYEGPIDGFVRTHVMCAVHRAVQLTLSEVPERAK